MSGFTPHKDHIKGIYAIADPPFNRPANVPEREHEFERWLGGHSAEVRAQAMEEAAWIAEATQTADRLVSPNAGAEQKDARSRLIAERIRASAKAMKEVS